MIFSQFISHVKVGLPSECWPWMASVAGRTGYGKMNFRGKTVGAHRLSFLLFNKFLPRDSIVCHSCDNRKCVNPHHLFLANQSENMIDCVSKGRHHMAAKTICKNGHSLSGSNVKMRNGRAGRRCLQCDREYYHKRKEATK